METHIKIVAILHIVLGSVTILIGLAMMLLFGGLAGLLGAYNTRDAVPIAGIVGWIGGLILIVLIAIGVPGIIAGIGMLQFRPWGRILGIIVSALDLVHMPFGTALGIYGLWALLSREGEMLFLHPPVRPAPYWTTAPPR
jgi:hypothetical protein